MQEHASQVLWIPINSNDRNQETLAQDFNVGAEITADMRTNVNVQETSSRALLLLASNDRNRDILEDESNAGAYLWPCGIS